MKRKGDATDGGADAARRAAELVKRLYHRRNARRVRVGEPEVVVRAKVERPLLTAGQTGWDPRKEWARTSRSKDMGGKSKVRKNRRRMMQMEMIQTRKKAPEEANITAT